MDESYYGGGGSAGLVRSTSVPSVNGVLKDMHALQVAGNKLKITFSTSNQRVRTLIFVNNIYKSLQVVS